MSIALDVQAVWDILVRLLKFLDMIHKKCINFLANYNEFPFLSHCLEAFLGFCLLMLIRCHTLENSLAITTNSLKIF